jgi:hypothetical protein
VSSSYAIEPDVPRDPLAAAESARWAVARRFAVLGLPLDEREQRLLESLEQLDGLLRALESDGTAAAAPASLVDGDAFSASDDSDDSDIELSPDEISDADQPDVAEAFVKAQARDRVQLATGDTIVLSGPDTKRKIRQKQSVMASYITQNLYEDIGALFAIGDREGALISLERLLTLAPITPQIETFLEHNEGRLLEYYENVLGPMSRIGKIKDGEATMPAGYFKFEKMRSIVGMIDGKTTLQDIIDRSGLRKIEACAVLSQLVRAAALDLGDKASTS